MVKISNKIIIELESWEAEKMNTALKYLVDKVVKNPENFKEVPDDCLKAMSWLIAFRHTTFDDKDSQNNDQPQDNG